MLFSSEMSQAGEQKEVGETVDNTSKKGGNEWTVRSLTDQEGVNFSNNQFWPKLDSDCAVATKTKG